LRNPNKNIINPGFAPKQFAILPLLTQFEQPPELFKELTERIDHSDQHEIQMAADAVFNVLLGTRKH
jgi:hypothetical protein